MNLTYLYNIRNEVVASAAGNTAENSTHFSNYTSFRSRIKKISTVSLIFLSMVTEEVFAGDKLPKSKASARQKKEATFESISLSSSLPDVIPQFLLPDLVPSNPPVTPPPPPLPDIVPPILPDLVPSVPSTTYGT